MYTSKQEIPEGTGLNVSHSSSSSTAAVKTQYSDEVTKSILRSAIHLTGKNYLTWSNHTAALLDLNGLWDVVSKPPKGRKFVRSILDADGVEEVDLNSSMVTAVHINDESEVRLAKTAWIFLNGLIKSEHIAAAVHHVPRDQPHALWLTLKEVCHGECEAAKAQWYSEFWKLKQGSNEDLNNLITRMNILVTNLIETGDVMKPELLATRFLDALGPAYATLVDALVASPIKLSLHEVQAKARNFEVRLKAKKVVPDRSPPESANGIDHQKGDHNDGGKPNRQKEIKCFWCQKKGHRVSECRTAPTCAHCKKKGHKEDKCYLKNGGKKKSEPKKDNSQGTDDGDLVEEVNSLGITEVSPSIIEFALDSACSRHAVKDVSILHDVQDCTDRTLKVANGNLLPVAKTGRLVLPTDDGGSLDLGLAMYHPSLTRNLLSVSQMNKVEGVTGVNLTADHGQVIGTEGQVLIEAPICNGMYLFTRAEAATSSVSVLDSVETQVETNTVGVSEQASNNTQELWHRRMSHLSIGKMKQLIAAGAVDGLPLTLSNVNEDMPLCEGCVKGKAHRKEFGKTSSHHAMEVLDRIHADLCGPLPESMGGAKYLMLIVDEATRFVAGFPLRNKDDSTKEIIRWSKTAAVKHNRQIKEFHSDCGGEFVNSELSRHFKSVGTLTTMTQPYTSKQNPIVERMNRTIIEATRASLQQCGAPKRLWADAALTAIRVHNITVLRKGEKETPYQQWYGEKPNIKNIREWGCDQFTHVPKELRKKLDAKSRKGIFIGYSEQQLGYRVMDIESMKVHVSRDVQFNEGSYTAAAALMKEERMNDDGTQGDRDDHKYYEDLTYRNEITLIQRVSAEEHGINVDKDMHKEAEEEEQKYPPSSVASSRPKRDRRPPMYYGQVAKGDLGQGHAVEEVEVTGIDDSDGDDPITVDEAFSGPEADAWRQAVKEELGSLNENSTWEPATLPAGFKVVGCKWVFKRKRDENGNVVRYKARLVCKGYTQRQGWDYNETFAPVLHHKTLRILLALVAKEDYELKHMDVKTAFLNATMKEEVYIQLPPGCPDAGTICRLKKTLYGLKQAPREWNEDFNNTITSMGYNRCISDPCVYIKTTKTGKSIIMGLFVDDIVPAFHKLDESEYEADKKILMNHYTISDLGDMKLILGMRVTRNRQKRVLTLDHEAKIEQLLRQYQMEQCLPVNTPEEPGTEVSSALEHDNEIVNVPYRELVGALNYLAVSTRPDICHAVSVLCRYFSCPTQELWTAAKRVLRYLRGSAKLGLTFDGGISGIGLEMTPCYSDSNWANDKYDRKSTSGWLIKFAGCTVNWSSKRQSTVALSTAEAEYMAMSEAVQEIMWTRQMLSELKLVPKAPTVLYCDNQAAIANAVNGKFHGRMKHVDIKLHFVRQAVQNSMVKMEWIPTMEQEADIFTKGLGGPQFNRLRGMIMSSEQV
jgi:hypothetical protein